MLYIFIYNHNKENKTIMAYIFQKGLPGWSDESGVTYVKESTEWTYPTKVKDDKTSSNTITLSYTGIITSTGNVDILINSAGDVNVGDKIYLDVSDNNNRWYGDDEIIQKINNLRYTIKNNIGINEQIPITSGTFKLYTNKYISRSIDKGVGVQPEPGPTYIEKKFTLDDFSFNIDPTTDDNHNTSASATAPTSDIGSWNATENITGNTNDSMFLFNQNTKSNTVEKESDIVVVGGFNLNIPTNAKINSVQLKITRKNFAFNDRDFNDEWDILGGDTYITVVDDFLLDNYINFFF